MYGNIRKLNDPTSHPFNRAAEADKREAEAVKAAQERVSK